MTRTVVVTGGKRGIGTAITAAFAAENVIALSSADLDVTDEDAVTRVFGEIGPVDVLVNNAGVSDSAPLGRTTLDGLGAPAGGQRDRRVPVHARGGRRHAGAQPRPDRDRRLRREPPRRALRRALHRVQARRARASCARSRPSSRGPA